MSVRYHWLTILCDIMGWVYFIAWSISFYPQVIINFRRKCVIGLSFDYQGIYNFTGFLFYSLFTIATFVHHGGDSNSNNPIAINDIAFAVHALCLTSVTCIQILIYDRGDQRPSWFCVILTSVLWIIACYNVVLSSVFNDLPWFGPMSTVSFLGYVKVTVTTVKYVPQAFMNCKDQSTTGWSIYNVLLDFTGGSLSILQQILSAYNTNDWGFVFENVPKLILGCESIFFDIIFMIQHYVLYGDNDSPLRQSKQQLMSKDKPFAYQNLSVSYDPANHSLASMKSAAVSNADLRKQNINGIDHDFEGDDDDDNKPPNVGDDQQAVIQ